MDWMLLGISTACAAMPLKASASMTVSPAGRKKSGSEKYLIVL